MLISEEHDYSESVKALRKLARENPEIQECGLEMSDNFLIAFIAGKKGDQKKAYKTIKTYVSIRRGKYNEFFKTVLPSRLEYLKEIPKFMAPFKPLEPSGCIVGLFNFSRLDFSVIDVDDMVRALIIFAEEAMLTLPELTRNGLVGIVDSRGLSFQHVKAFPPHRIQFIFNVFMGSLPIRYKTFHVLYDSFLFDPFIKLIKMFAPKKIRERLQLHKTGTEYSSLHKSVPPSILPDYLGGELSEADSLDLEFQDRAFAKEEHWKNMALKWSG